MWCRQATLADAQAVILSDVVRLGRGDAGEEVAYELMIGEASWLLFWFPEAVHSARGEALLGAVGQQS